MLQSLDAIHLVSAFLLDAAVVLESGPFEGGGDFNVVKCLSQECRSWGRAQPHLSARPGCRLPFGEDRRRDRSITGGGSSGDRPSGRDSSGDGLDPRSTDHPGSAGRPGG